jgi:hypothetical protein
MAPAIKSVEPATHYLLKYSTTDFSPLTYTVPLELDNTEDSHYEIGLVAAHCTKSWHTISAALNNNRLLIGGTPLLISDGAHSIDTVEEEIKAYLVTAHSQEIADSFDITKIVSLGRCSVKAPTGLAIQLDTIAPVLGFAVGATIAAGVTTIGTATVDFSGGVREVEVECNLVAKKYVRSNNRTVGLLHCVAPPMHPPFSRFDCVEHQYFVPMEHSHYIRELEINLVNQDGLPINLNGEPADFVIAIKKANRQ